MYHVLETGVTVSVLYLISFSLYRTGFFTQTFHRKLWNILLAATFLFTAIAGIFMALQINYRWNIPIIKSLRSWHVETGICMALAGSFHFIWHLSYFGKIFAKSGNSHVQINAKPLDISVVRHNLFVIGFVSTAVQFLLMREILNISGGYELITGVMFGSWLVASAAGAAIAGQSALNDIPKINLIFSISPLISLFLMVLLAGVFTGTGETPSILNSIVITFLLLLPFCLVSGFLFIKLLDTAKRIQSIDPGKSFSIETTGGIIAGLTTSFLTAGVLNTYQILLIVILLYIAYTLLNFYIKTKKVKIVVKLSFTVLLSLVILSKPDIIFRQLLLPGIRVTETTDTPYGNITKGEYSGEISIYYNNRLLAYNDDVIEREENIHYALLQIPDPRSVILISGFPEPLVKEIYKYPVKKVVFIERDPALVRGAALLSHNGERLLTTENKDAYRYIRSKGDKVDAVILLLPPPSTLSLNRYYTTEYFRAVKQRLNDGGVFMCSPGPGDNYLNKESIKLYSSIFNSLAGVFRHVLPVSGNKLYFIASDEELSVEFCRLTALRGISNTYVSPDYLSDDLTLLKSAEVVSAIDRRARENKSSFPVASFHFQSFNFSRDLNEKIPAIILLIAVFAIPGFSIRRRNLIMYFSSSALAGFEIIILFSLQLTAGNMYQFTGIILAAVMSGLAAGAATDNKISKKLSLRIKALLLILFYAAAALSFSKFIEVRSLPLILLFILISALIPSFLTGHIFRDLTMQTVDGSNPSRVYSADLAGSALGFMFISGLAVPVLGIKISIYLLASLIFIGILFGANRNK
jgi:predicted membrane-bound spermidine synthase